MQPRQRSWAFDQYPEMPHGKQWVLKVKVPAASPPTQLMDMAGALQSCTHSKQSSVLHLRVTVVEKGVSLLAIVSVMWLE